MAGLEPVTSAVTGQRSNQLSYTPFKGEPNGREREDFRQHQFLKICDNKTIRTRRRQDREGGKGKFLTTDGNDRARKGTGSF